MTTATTLNFAAIIAQALTEPGIISKAYSAFHNFSLGNQILAAIQLTERGMPLSPIASFNNWKEKGRFVKKGQKAIQLFLPVTIKRKAADEAAGESNEAGSYQVFMLKPHWFSLDQTDGAEFAPELKIPAWDAVKAMQALDIEETRFDDLRGNCMGYASGRKIAINPVNPFKHKTRFHEIAHIVLGHTGAGDMSDGAEIPRDIREAEAEGVAYLLCTLLDLPGQVESRGYIQGWLAGADLPEKSARRIVGAADKIMKAGA